MWRRPPSFLSKTLERLLKEGREVIGKEVISISAFWAKTVTSVDKNLQGAESFRGEVLPKNEEVELPWGTLVIHVYPDEVRGEGAQEASLFRVDDEGMVGVDESGYNWSEDFSDFQNYVQETLDEAAQEDPPEVTLTLTRADVGTLLRTLEGPLLERFEQACNVATPSLISWFLMKVEPPLSRGRCFEPSIDLYTGLHQTPWAFDGESYHHSDSGCCC